MSYEYKKEQLYKMGQVYTAMLHILNPAGRDPYPCSEIFPFKYIVMVIPRTMKIGISHKLNDEIAKLMDEFDPDEVGEMMETPVPLEMRQYWTLGCMRYEQLTTESKIAQVRKKAGITQAELAKKIGVGQKDISRWENHVYTPSEENFKKLSAALCCKVEDLREE